MSSLSDQIDRLSRSTKAIKTTTAQIALPRGSFKLSDIGVAGPFTRAVLETYLGDLIRDIDASELGLFQLTNSSEPSDTENDVPRFKPSELARTEFGSATPLKRIVTRRDESTRLNAEPEIYAHAAMHFIDKYDPIQRMPRARSQATAILERIGDVRQNIRALLQALDQQVKHEDASSIKSLIEHEEDFMDEIRTKIAELKQRKNAALDWQKPAVIALGTPEVELNLSKERLNSTSATRVLHFTDNLLEEVINPGNLANISVAGHLGENDLSPYPISQSTPSLQQILDNEKPLAVQKQHNTENEQDVDHATIESGVQGRSLSTNQPGQPCGLGSAIASPSTSPSESSNYIGQTDNDIESITRKIWEKAADILGPFDQSDRRGFGKHANNVPGAKQILARLELLSQSDIPQDSVHAATEASTSTATSVQPTGQQILTAHFLLVLFSEAPHYSVPLNKIKELLAAKASGNASVTAAQGTSRIIYGCVAKRLVKIDRSGREQIVKFDV